jgi:uncharacterized protein (DUF697 family)/GTP-binding protein EngB required for normal cell division
MPLPRLILILLGLCLILGLVAWLVSAIGQLYWQVSWVSPWLGTLLIGLIVALLGLAIAALAYYLNAFGVFRWGQQRQTAPLPPKVSEVKSEAAAETLKAVRQQVERIQDTVARQALLEKSREIEESLARGELLVVVFGTGSAGKTSTINALLGRVAGKVGAPMGTTETGETYGLRLRGMEREIVLADTPGILEAGAAGTRRERLARRLATEADLLLFVIDEDLRQSEYEPLKLLAGIGKRSLVVLNKRDRYPDEDVAVILQRVRQRLAGLVPPGDVVAIAANPIPVRLADGSTLQPEPDVMPLVRRMVAVLRSEGEELIADNMLLQAQRLSDKARKLVDSQRRRQAEKIVERYQWIGAGAVAVTPLPGLDLVAAAAVNAQMVLELGRAYGCDLNRDRAQELALSLAKTLTSLGILKGALGALTFALQTNIGTVLVGKAIQAVTAAYLTRIAGKSFIEYFRHDQDWGDGGITQVVQQQFQLNQRDRVVKSFVKDAIAKVIEPLNLAQPEPENIPQNLPQDP